MGHAAPRYATYVDAPSLMHRVLRTYCMPRYMVYLDRFLRDGVHANIISAPVRLLHLSMPRCRRLTKNGM